MDIGIITPEASSRGSAEASAAAAAPSEPFSICIQKSQQGSGLLKHQRSAFLPESWWPTKIPKTDSFSMGHSPGSLRSGSVISENTGQTMISFSSQPQISHFPDGDGAKSSAFPFFLCSPEPPCSRTTGYHAEKSGAGREPFSGFRGPFTPSQWMELEHHAMIYKYFMSNIPVPSQLLIPLRKAFNPYPFSSLSSGLYASNSRFGANSDPEPGRCRRTDGKKWRCSRDAVPDQKYCDRHINRGRHRSRKPVEGQPGHAVSGSTAPKVAPNAVSSALVMSNSSASNSLGALQHRFNTLQPNAPNSSTGQLASRLQDLHGLSSDGDIFKLNEAKQTPLSSQKQHSPFGSSPPEFGLVSPDSLLNPSQRSSSRNSDSLLGFNDQEEHDQYLLRHFIDSCPKNQSTQALSWPEELKLDWTQLSMSMPVSSSDFSSSSNSPELEKPKLSTLKSSHVPDTTMGLNVVSEPNQKKAHWLPVSWGDSVGGPLGEALNGAPSVAEGLKNPATLNLITDTSDKNPRLGCSPTGVLQKSTFVSLSNSSSGNSPGAGTKKAPAGTGLRDDILGAPLVNSASIPYI